MEKQTNKSDRSSNDSDLKVEIRTASSLSNMQEHDSEHWDDGASDAHLKNESLYRYSDYLDPVFPPKPVGLTLNVLIDKGLKILVHLNRMATTTTVTSNTPTIRETTIQGCPGVVATFMLVVPLCPPVQA